MFGNENGNRGKIGEKKQDTVIQGLYPEPCKFVCLFSLLKVLDVFNVIKSA